MSRYTESPERACTFNTDFESSSLNRTTIDDGGKLLSDCYAVAIIYLL